MISIIRSTSIINLTDNNPNGSYIYARDRDRNLIKKLLANEFKVIFIGNNSIVFVKQVPVFEHLDKQQKNIYSPTFNGWNRSIYEFEFGNAGRYPVMAERMNYIMIEEYSDTKKTNIYTTNKTIFNYLGGE